MRKMKFNKKNITYTIIITCIVILLSGCATQSIQKNRGITLYHNGEYDDAVKHFEQAIKEKPTTELKTLLFRAKVGSYYYHLGLARKFRKAEKKDEAIKEYKIALKIFPNNKSLMQEIDFYLNPQKNQEQPFKSTITPPVTLSVDPTEKMTLNLKNTPITKIFNVMGKSYGINFIFDKDFRDFVYSIEVEDIGFYEVLNQLCMVGNAEYRILDQQSVLIYPNTTFKKRTFGLRGVKVYYLSNIKAEDAKKLLMAVFRDEQIMVQEDSNLNTLIIKAEYNTLAEIERFLSSIDKRKSEVVLDVEILEVSKNIINALGTSYGSPDSPIATLDASPLDSSGTPTGTINLKDFSDVNFVLTVPTAALSFLESSDKNRLIAKPNLRGVDGEEIKFMVGDEVPIPQTQFQASAAGGVSNVPVTTYNYQKVGVTVKLTPYVHNENEITIKLKLEIKSITAYTNEFPTFGTRELETVIRLKEGETNIIGGFIKDEFRKGLQGVSGFSRIPIIGKLFGEEGKESKETDLVFSITPRIIHRVEVTSLDQKPIWSNMQAPAQNIGQGPEAHPPQSKRPGSNSIIISPAKRRLPVNQVSYFTLRVNTSAKLASLALSGSISGGNAVIEEAKTDFFGSQKVQVLSNVSDSSFDFGYSFPPTMKTVNVVAQLKIKFTEKGNYTINLNNVTGISQDRQTVSLSGTSAEIEVH